MGNGVGIDVGDRGDSIYRYQKLEKLCRSGYFHQDKKAYKEALEQAIRTNSLDCLELLLVSGDARKIQPLHLACSLGKLDPVELIISAGFNGDLDNQDSRTPLHLCCLAASAEAGLCCSVVALQFPRSRKKLDYMGLGPIHLAAQIDNLPVFKALIAVDKTLLNHKCQSGKTPLIIAKEKKSSNVEEFINFFSASQANLQPIGPAFVDQSRIMEIWERFFENAFKSAGVAYDDVDSECEDIIDTENAVSRQSFIQACNVDHCHNTSYDSDDWFWWIVCFDHDLQVYFVVNSWSKDKMYLDEFWNNICIPRSYDFVYKDIDEISQLPYPQSLSETQASGWLTYFHHDENYCEWMNILSFIFEYFLPLGLTEGFDNLQLMNLKPSEDDEIWYEADQSVCRAWVFVVSDNSEANYFLNTITQHTQWEAPSGWTKLVSSWNNWILCCSESNIAALFW
jgi:hypothetical protein